MREELRRRLPKTTGWGIGIVLGLMVILLAIAYAVYHFAVADSPSAMIQSFMTAARDNDLEGMRGLLTEDSKQSPSCERWLGQLAVALGKRKAVMKNADMLGDRATVHVLVEHRSASGDRASTDVGIETIRTKEGWQVNLERTMASVPHQFWTTITTAPE
jgi:hypothetical protein